MVAVVMVIPGQECSERLQDHWCSGSFVLIVLIAVESSENPYTPLLGTFYTK